MDFKDEVVLLGKRVLELREHVKTEEATKNSFILPFLRMLGFDVYDPREVVAEFVADIGTKKGEKVDFAVYKDGQVILLIECKHWEQNLNLHDNQLLRYFHAARAKFGLLTNGVHYRFYTDLEATNVMDEKPFLEFDITRMKENQIAELKKFHKSVFDVTNISNTASELKYTSALRELLSKELTSPSEQFVRYFASQVYTGRLMPHVLEQFTCLLTKSINQYLSDMITDKFKAVVASEEAKKEEDVKNNTPCSCEENDGIVTTEEELEGFGIVKAILCQKLPAGRVTYRDAKSYFAILLDDNARRPLCRLYYNGKKKYLGLFNDPANFVGSGAKNDRRVEVAGNESLYAFAADLLETAELYLKSKPETPSEKREDGETSSSQGVALG